VVEEEWRGSESSKFENVPGSLILRDSEAHKTLFLKIWPKTQESGHCKLEERTCYDRCHFGKMNFERVICRRLYMLWA